MSSKRMPDVIDAEHWRRLDKQWANFGQTLMERDGNSLDFTDGGHNIKHNPFLRAAIEDLRDGYMQLYHQQQLAHLALKEIERDYKSRYPEDINGRRDALKAMRAASDYQQATNSSNDAEYDLILFTSQSAQRLQSSGLGFNEAERTEILASAKEGDVKTPDQQLSKKDAMSIIGSIIGRSIKSYETVFSQYQDFQRPYIIHTAFKPPESSSRRRSTPNIIFPPPRDWTERVSCVAEPGSSVQTMI